MKLIDANLLLYAYNSSFDLHLKAKSWLETTLNSHDLVGLSWSTILAFIRISTSFKAFPEPLTTQEASDHVNFWLSIPIVRVIHPNEHHWDVLKKVFWDAQVRGPLVSDAHLVALAIENGATLCSSDNDFRKFRQIQFINPME